MMSISPIRMLIVDDSCDDAELMVRALRRHGYGLEWLRVTGPEALRTALGSPLGWDLVVCDSTIPLFGAERILSMTQAFAPSLPILLVSGHAPIELAGVLETGVVRGFVSKDCLDDLPAAIDTLRPRAWTGCRIRPRDRPAGSGARAGFGRARCGCRTDADRRRRHNRRPRLH